MTSTTIDEPMTNETGDDESLSYFRDILQNVFGNLPSLVNEISRVEGVDHDTAFRYIERDIRDFLSKRNLATLTRLDSDNDLLRNLEAEVAFVKRIYRKIRAPVPDYTTNREPENLEIARLRALVLELQSRKPTDDDARRLECARLNNEILELRQRIADDERKRAVEAARCRDVMETVRVSANQDREQRERLLELLRIVNPEETENTITSMYTTLKRYLFNYERLVRIAQDYRVMKEEREAIEREHVDDETRNAELESQLRKCFADRDKLVKSLNECRENLNAYEEDHNRLLDETDANKRLRHDELIAKDKEIQDLELTVEELQESVTNKNREIEELSQAMTNVDNARDAIQMSDLVRSLKDAVESLKYYAARDPKLVSILRSVSNSDDLREITDLLKSVAATSIPCDTCPKRKRKLPSPEPSSSSSSSSPSDRFAFKEKRLSIEGVDTANEDSGENEPLDTMVISDDFA